MGYTFYTGVGVQLWMRHKSRQYSNRKIETTLVINISIYPIRIKYKVCRKVVVFNRNNNECN